MRQQTMTAAELKATLGKGKSGKPSKYRNKKVTVAGVTYDSKKEAKVGAQLATMQKYGEISGLERQVRFRLIVNGFHICDYIADFVHYEKKGKRIVTDVKGMKTPIYKLKAKLMLACHGITITEM